MPTSALVLDEVQRNFEVFEAALPSLLKDHFRMFALMRHGEFIDFFDTAADAHRAGKALYADDLFSIQEVRKHPIDLGYFSHAVHSQ